MAAGIQITGFVLLVLAVAFFRLRAPVAPSSSPRIMAALIAAPLLISYALNDCDHKCDAGTPVQQGLIPGILLAYWIVRVRVSIVLGAIGAAVIASAGVMLSNHYVDAVHGSDFIGHGRSSFVRPIEAAWHTPVTGLYRRLPFALGPEVRTTELIEGYPHFWGFEEGELILDELKVRSENEEVATLIRGADVHADWKESLLEDLGIEALETDEPESSR